MTRTNLRPCIRILEPGNQLAMCVTNWRPSCPKLATTFWHGFPNRRVHAGGVTWGPFGSQPVTLLSGGLPEDGGHPVPGHR